MDAIRAMPWNIVPFVIGMFILVESLTASGWIEAMAVAGAAAVGKSRLTGILASGGECVALVYYIAGQPPTKGR